MTSARALLAAATRVIGATAASINLRTAFSLEPPDKTPCRQLTGKYVQLETLEAPAMKLTDFVDGVPDAVWAAFEPLLPPVVWKGVGRKPKRNRACLHGLLYVLIAGIGWELLPKGTFP